MNILEINVLAVQILVLSDNEVVPATKVGRNNQGGFNVGGNNITAQVASKLWTWTRLQMSEVVKGYAGY